ncbi:rhodanese-like domain-containing protein [uncultured Rhodoblastus sp.]|uniref:rhodanese-like domain-containing protein n=1 Tax=uncultured Rhodoblastus sp. TaxID=543037 RepID=UPI0025EDC608|nr:rhodanese-like domain-containing protein [uncultured Rhodoblastus sp.]
MRKILPLLLLSATLASPVFAQTPSPAAPARPAFVYNFKTPELHRASIDALLAVPSHVLFVDLRRPDEISKIGTFPVYLNVQAADLEKNIDFIPKDRPIVTVSNHAARAGKAADYLAAHGFPVVGAVGSQVYEEEGGAIVKVAIPTPRPVAAAPAAVAPAVAAAASTAADSPKP